MGILNRNPGRTKVATLNVAVEYLETEGKNALVNFEDMAITYYNDIATIYQEFPILDKYFITAFSSNRIALAL